MAYHHDYNDFGEKVLRGDGLKAHLDAIAEAAGKIAHSTAPVETGTFRDSFVVGTAVEDHEGLRAVGFLASTDDKAAEKEFTNPNEAQNLTMNKAMQKAIG